MINIKKLSLERLFLTNPIPMWIYDKDTLRFLAVNEAAQKLYGYTEKEYLNMTVKDIRPEEDIPLLLKIDANTGSVSPPLRKTFRQKKSDGSIMYVEVDSDDIKFDGKNARRIFVRDVTSSKLAQEQLKESERKFATLISNLPGLVYRCKNDHEWTMEFLSEGCYNLTGYQPRDLLYNNNVSYNQLILKEDQDNVYRSVEKALSEKRDFEITYRIKTQQDQIKWVWEKGRGIYSDDGNVVAIEGVIDDITSIKNAEIALKDAKAKSEEMNWLKSIILANVSHELKTPMIGIIGYAEALQKEMRDPKLKEMVDTLVGSSNRLRESLDVLLDFANIEFQKIEVKYEEINISDTLVDIVKKLKPFAESKGLKLDLNLNATHTFALLDKQLFSQIMNNLLHNAIKYTDKGGVSVTLENDEDAEQFYSIIKVKDTGIGISKENIDKVFQPFRQASEGFSRKFEGMGLGLTISKKFSEYLNGKIQIESEEGVGTTFSLRIPSVKKHAAKKLEETVISRQPRTEGNLPSVLFVENDIPTIGIIKLFLSEVCNVDYATSGEKALEVVKNKNYAAVLMDIDLGMGIDGVETTKLIRRMPSYKDVPIIAVTAYAMTGDKEKFLAAGCSHYLAKPFPKSKLVNLLKEIIN